MVYKLSSAASSRASAKDKPVEIHIEPLPRKERPKYTFCCGICKKKFDSNTQCSEHMKLHARVRSADVTACVDSLTHRSILSMATLSGHIPSPPTSPPPPQRPQTAGEPLSATKAHSSPSHPHPHSQPPGDETQRDLTLMLMKRSMSEPSSDRKKKQGQGQPGQGQGRSGGMGKRSRGGGLDSSGASAGPGKQTVAASVPEAWSGESTGKVYVCFYCQVHFYDALSLTQHSRTHGASKPYSCTQCGRMFALYSSLVTHERSHAPESAATVFRCRSCHASFLHEASLKAHQRRHVCSRSGPETKPYQCDTCHEWVSNEGSLKIHMQRHESFDAPRICTLCGTGFSSDTILRAHGKMHEAEASTRCVICVRHFRRSRVLLRHSDVHAEKRQNVCDSCEKRFPKVSDGSWRRMRLLLPEDRQFQCLYCGASFSRLHQLAAHESGHTAPPPADRIQLTHHAHFPAVVVN